MCAVFNHNMKAHLFPSYLQLHEGVWYRINWVSFYLERFIKVSLGSAAPAKIWRLCLIQNANEAAWVFAYLNLDYSKQFCRKVNLDLEAQPAGSWVSALLEWCSIHRRRRECVLSVCAHLYICVHADMCLCVCMRVWTGGATKEKAHLSQHALEPSRGQPAVQVFSNEEHSWANQSSLPMRWPQLPANQTREVQRSDRQNWWEE